MGKSLQDVCAKLRDEQRLRIMEMANADADQLTNVNTPADLTRIG